MSAIQLVYPVGKNWPISQDFAGHIATAKKYGWCIAPGTNCPNGYYYPGEDWACANRTKGRVAAAGVITKAGLDPTTAKDPTRGYGNRLQVLHDNGWQTVYAHLAEWYVNVGDRVTPDNVAYLTDNTGYSTGPHIHFELRDEKGVPIDPMPYLVTSIEPEPPIEPPYLFTLPTIPDHQSAHCVVDGLRVHSMPVPGTKKTVGELNNGNVMVVLGMTQVKQDYWFIVLLPDNTVGWAAAYYQGETYLEVV